MPCRDEWGIDPEKLNPFGGAIALGHPFGMTGARIMTTLLNDLDALDGTIGLETMCVAGGMGQAMIVERLSLSGQRAPAADAGDLLGEVADGLDRLAHLLELRLDRLRRACRACATIGSSSSTDSRTSIMFWASGSMPRADRRQVLDRLDLAP